METSIRVQAPAKLNLHLRVYGRRPDGFHGILSIFQGVSIADDILVRSLKENDSIRISGTFDCPPESTTLYKAARAFKDATSITQGLSLEAEKRIPAGAGMGGGSSDAASVILGLDRLFDCRLSAGEMAAIGAKVGSDVPFFLGDGPALVSGRGELLEPLPPRDDLHFVVAWPGRPVSTPWAYARLDAERPSDAAEPDPTKEELLAAWRKPPSAWPFANSFTGAIVKAVPEIGLLLDFLRGAGAGFAEMSGSGSAVFGLFAGQEEAESAAWRLRRAVLAGKLPSGSLVWTCAALARLPTLG